MINSTIMNATKAPLPNFNIIPAIAAVTLLALSLIIILYNVSWKPKASSLKPPPPEAGGAWPIIGHLALLGGSKPPHIALGKLTDEYGPIFTIWMGVHRTLVVSNWEIAKECFTTNDRLFANRPKAIAAEHMAYNNAMLPFSAYGPYWRELHRIATLELLSSHRLVRFDKVRESEVKTAIKVILRQWTEENNTVLVDMKSWFGELTLNLAMRTVVGKRKDEDDRFQRAIREFFKLAGMFVLGDAIPWLRWLDFGGYERDMKRTGKELDEVAQGLLDEHKRSRHENDFMGVMVSFLDGSEEIYGRDSDTVNKSTCLALILGGSNTSMVTLTWALSLLLNNGKALNKVQQELDEQVGRERLVKESDLKNLIYLQAVLKETLRLYPAGPLLLPHMSLEDCTVAGHHIPKGTRLVVNASKLHRDPNVWSDPNDFVPERFLTTHKHIDVRGHDFELIPFGAGRRVCPGISFALQVTQLALASLLHGFEVRAVSDESLDMSEAVGLTNLKASPLDVFVTPRLSAEAYY